jgi:phospholipid/cholesterol/gamma-HCH transport system ATP-binding protein
MSAIALELRNIEKAFDEKVVHQGLNLTLQEGELMGLLGGSGSGKSVVLRSIIGLEKPDAGEILFDGRDITQLNELELIEVRKRIAYVFQNGALFDSLTVEENLAYPLQEHTNLSETEIRRRVDAMLELIDMPGSNGLLPAELSGGMQKRAGLARAIILEPKVILFDEPTAGLDPVNTKRLISNIQRLKERGMTGIFVSHDIPTVKEIADRVAILHKGRIPIVGTVAELQNSKDPLVQSFLADTHVEKPAKA